MMEEITNCTRLQTYILTCISWELIHFLNQPQVATGRTAVFSFFLCCLLFNLRGCCLGKTNKTNACQPISCSSLVIYMQHV